MITPADDPEIRNLLQRLKAEDRRHAPSIEEILQRPAQGHSSSSHRGWAIVASLAAITLVAGIMLTLAGRNVQNDQSGTRLASAHPTTGSAGEFVIQPVRPAGIDFKQLRDDIDEYFERWQVPDWDTPTDSLLVVNFDLSNSQE